MAAMAAMAFRGDHSKTRRIRGHGRSHSARATRAHVAGTPARIACDNWYTASEYIGERL